MDAVPGCGLSLWARVHDEFLIMRIALFVIGAACILASGCSVVSANRVFPKLAWYWSSDAKAQREYDRQHAAEVKAYQESLKKSSSAK